MGDEEGFGSRTDDADEPPTAAGDGAGDRPSRRTERIGPGRVIRAVALVLALVSLLFAGLRIDDFFDSRDAAREAAESDVVVATRQSANAVDRLMTDLASTVDALAADLTDGTVVPGDPDDVGTPTGGDPDAVDGDTGPDGHTGLDGDTGSGGGTATDGGTATNADTGPDGAEDEAHGATCPSPSSAAPATASSDGGVVPSAPDPAPTSSTTGLDDLELALCAAARSIPELNGIGIVFTPDHDPEYRYRPYANRIDGALHLGELRIRDFTATDWFADAIEAGHGVWTHPRYGVTSQALLALYSAPFYVDGEVRGVVLASYGLDRLAADLRWLSIGSVGYSIVVSDEGRVVSHPSELLVSDELEGSVRLGEDLRRSASSTVIRFRDELAASDAASGFVVGVDDDVTDATAWLAWEPIDSVGWKYGTVVVEREVFSRTAEQNRLLVEGGLALLAGLLFIVVVAVGHRASDASLWTISISAGTLAVAGVAWLWFLTLTGPAADRTEADDLDWSAVASRLTLGDPALDDSDETGTGPLFAGVFVQSVEFTGANDVTVSGIVWQEQFDDLGLAEPPGFVFPEADDVNLERVYDSTIRGRTRVGWSFTASLRQTFDYSRYPLDRETVWLRLWPADYAERPWFMLPDLTSYETLAPSAEPGIERDVVVEGWELEASSFSYRDNSYNTDFGLRNISNDPTPELYFNVHLKRSFLDAAMSQLVPLSVVAILIFSVLLITTRRRTGDDEDHLQFSALGVLGYCAALFFVAILSHEQLRSNLNSGEVIYLEYFYFATYAAILGVSANAILVGAGRGGRFIDYRNNLLPSLLYWPALNGAILAVTVVTFY